MSLDIPASTPAPTGPSTAPAAGRPEAESARGARALAEPAVIVGTLPASPPPTVLDAIAVAAGAYAQLAADGREARFEIDPRTGRVTVEVRDFAGNLLSIGPPSLALALAAGADIH
jgi:hypothetical protein